MVYPACVPLPAGIGNSRKKLLFYQDHVPQRTEKNPQTEAASVPNRSKDLLIIQLSATREKRPYFFVGFSKGRKNFFRTTKTL